MDKAAWPAIGSWHFDAAGARLIGPGGESKLEDRAARTLTLLCRNRGEVVGHADILAEVWHGRAVSAGSVAVVMRDLRRALQDDARNPRFIVTVPKRGYRLAADDAQAALPQAAAVAALPAAPVPPLGRVSLVRPRLLTMAGVGLSVMALAVLARGPAERGRPASLTVEPVQNDTGNAAFEPLSRALSRLVVTHLAGTGAMSIVEGGATPVPPDASALVLRASLILWNGQPTLSLTESNALSGAVIWARMADGPEPALAGNTVKALQDIGRPSV
jgi:DNA-binding winged helix-turn-helix (wHTH) protein